GCQTIPCVFVLLRPESSRTISQTITYEGAGAMDEQENPSEPNNLTVEQAIRLKHEIEKSITYTAQFDSQQVVILQSISSEQWARVRHQYDDWYRRMNVISARVLFVVSCLGIIVSAIVFRFHYNIWIAICGLSLAIYAAGELARRSGHREGYMDGYDAGHEQGICDALGIDEKQAAEVRETAKEGSIASAHTVFQQHRCCRVLLA